MPTPGAVSDSSSSGSTSKSAQKTRLIANSVISIEKEATKSFLEFSK